MQHPIDNADARAVLASLKYARDVRRPPDDRRLTQIRVQGQRTTRSESMTEQRLRKELFWANLGCRAGRRDGPASDTTINAMFNRFAAIIDGRDTRQPGGSATRRPSTDR